MKGEDHYIYIYIYNNGGPAAREGHKAKGKEEAGSEEGRIMKCIEHRNAKMAHHRERERDGVRDRVRE